jgi:hypothetical protein
MAAITKMSKTHNAYVGVRAREKRGKIQKGVASIVILVVSIYKRTHKSVNNQKAHIINFSVINNIIYARCNSRIAPFCWHCSALRATP